MNTKLAKVLVIGLVWTCMPFQDLPSLNTFRNALPSYEATTAQVLSVPRPDIQCEDCQVVWWPWMLEYQAPADQAALQSCGSAPAAGQAASRQARR